MRSSDRRGRVLNASLTHLLLFLVNLMLATWLTISAIDYANETARHPPLSKMTAATCRINDTRHGIASIARSTSGCEICVEYTFRIDRVLSSAGGAAPVRFGTIRDDCVQGCRYRLLLREYVPGTEHPCLYRTADPDELAWPYEDPERFLPHVVASSCLLAVSLIGHAVIRLFSRYGGRLCLRPTVDG